jgi:hypothetical protein
MTTLPTLEGFTPEKNAQWAEDMLTASLIEVLEFAKKTETEVPHAMALFYAAMLTAAGDLGKLTFPNSRSAVEYTSALLLAHSSDPSVAGSHIAETIERYAFINVTTGGYRYTISMPWYTGESKGRRVLHRADGPAQWHRKQGDASERWYNFGHLHREGGLPASTRTRDGVITLTSWYVNGVPHRVGGLPACVSSSGDAEWWVNGEYHRDGDQPAVVRADGTQQWYQNGVLHRVGRPAVTWADGSKFWYQHGVLHRDGDQPAVVRGNGDQEWHQNGVRHRGGGPAVVEANGSQEWWFREGELHRVDGPAVVRVGGTCCTQWWVNGKRICLDRVAND